MKRQLFILSTMSFFLLAPIAQPLIYGTEAVSTVVATEKVINDEQLNHAIKDAISADAILVKYIDKVHIKVDGGVVTLSGVVSSSDIKSNLEAKAKAVMGVKKVVDNIEIKKAEVK